MIFKHDDTETKTLLKKRERVLDAGDRD